MIPELLLEEILLGEKDEKDYYEKYGKEELLAALSKLRESNEEILKSYPADKAYEDFIKKSFEVKNAGFSKNAGTNAEHGADGKKKPRILKFASNFYDKINQFQIIKYSAAAAVVFALVTPLALKNMSTTATPASVRIKGIGTDDNKIRLYKQSGNDALLLKDGDEACENDLIQITYTPGSYKFGLIFSVDGNGNVTRHFPEDSWTSAKLEHTGEEVPLSFSYSLDDAPRYECFVFVASKKAFDMSALDRISKDSYSIDFIKSGSYLPQNCNASVFVLNKR